MMEKYVFLDFNGTVLDDLDLCIELLNKMLIERDVKPIDKERYLNIFGFPIIKYYEKAGFDFSKYSFAELADEFINDYTRLNVKECHIFADVEEFVEAVKRKGYKIVLCSASKYDLLIDQLKFFKIENLFDDVIALDNHHATSKEELALAYCHNHHVAVESSYFIGDTTHDFEVAKSCGAIALLVSRGHQSIAVLSSTGAIIHNSLVATLKDIL